MNVVPDPTGTLIRGDTSFDDPDRVGLGDDQARLGLGRDVDTQFAKRLLEKRSASPMVGRNSPARRLSAGESSPASKAAHATQGSSLPESRPSTQRATAMSSRVSSGRITDQ